MANSQSTRPRKPGTALVRAPRHGGMEKYDPKAGLQRIAVSELGEKHWARAKDPVKLEHAIRAKLEAQAEFVLWWDTKGPGAQGPGRPEKNGNRSVTISAKAGRDGLPSKMLVSRWRQKFNDPDKFEQFYNAAAARYLKILELQTIDQQLKASESNEWYTPARYVEAARRVLGAFDLDPASNPSANETIQAETYYTIDDSGLTKDWHGRVWLNPPYGGMSGPFTAKLIEEFAAGNVSAAMLLVNANSTDAGWFQPLWDYLLCFTNHRINFTSPTGSESGSTHGSVFIYLGPDRDRFVAEFSTLGAVVERAV